MGRDVIVFEGNTTGSEQPTDQRQSLPWRTQFHPRPTLCNLMCRLRGSLFSTALLVVILAGAGCTTVTEATAPDMLPLVLPETAPQTTVIIPPFQPPVLVVIEPKAATVEAIVTEVYDPWKLFNGMIHAFNTGVCSW